MICENCGKEHEGVYGSGRFCSHSCQASYTNKHRKLSNETKKKISESIHNLAKPKTCKICQKQFIKGEGYNFSRVFCSEECHKKYLLNKTFYDSLNKTEEQLKQQHDIRVTIGKKSAAIQAETRRSKNEKYFCELCESYFNNVTHNDPMFNGWDADVLIHDLNIAVLWNGPWHYKQISKSQSLLQVQNRDKIKIQEIINFGWKPYIIKDLGKYNPNFVKEQFDIFIKSLKN